MELENTEHTVRDGDRELTFVGALLSEANTDDGEKPRWSAMALYRTETHQYVVHGVGKTRVPGEVDREWVKVCTTADGLPSVLTRESKGVSYMPYVNMQLLARAGQVDDDVSDAYRTQHIA